MAWAWARRWIAHVELLNRLLMFACLTVNVARSINFPDAFVPSIVDKVLTSLATVQALRTRACPKRHRRITIRHSCNAVHRPARRRASASNPVPPRCVLGTAVCIAVACLAWCRTRFASMLRRNGKRLTNPSLGAVSSAVGIARITIGARLRAHIPLPPVEVNAILWARV